MNLDRTIRGATAGLAAVAMFAAAAGPAGAASPGTGNYRVDTLHDTIDAAPGDGACADAAGDCSLRAAVMELNAGGHAGNIALGPDTYVLSQTGSDEAEAATGDLDVTGTIKISGVGTIDLAGFGDRAFDVMAGASLSVVGVTVKNGAPAEGESGGAFRSAGSLELTRVTLSDNAVEGSGASGGAVLNLGGDLTVEHSHLSGNSAARAGGAIEANAGTTTIRGTVMRANVTGVQPGNGGAFHLTGPGTVIVENSRILDNVAAAEGGGLWNSAVGTMSVSRTTLQGNIANGTDADQGGGGLFNDGGAMTIDRSRINDNSAVMGSGSGGGIFNNSTDTNSGALTITGSILRANEAARAGGGIETKGGSVHATQLSMVDNSAGPRPGNGGGLHVSGPATVDITNALVAGNVASNEGGGLWNSAAGTMTLDRIRVSDNEANGTEADNGGGGVFNQGNADGTSGGVLTITNSKISDNRAMAGSGSGGGLLNEQGTAKLDNVTISGNSAARAGGGVEAVGGSDATVVGSTTLTRVDVMSNVTGAKPGNGGGLHLTGSGVVTIDRGRIIKNEAANEGGGLWNSPSGSMVVTRTWVAGNVALIEGNGPNVFQKGPVSGDGFTTNGKAVEAGPNTIGVS